MTATSALRFTAARVVTVRALVAFLGGVLIAGAFVLLVEALVFGLVVTHILPVESPGEGVGVVILPLYVALSLSLPVIMLSTVLIFRRLSRSESARQSSNNRSRGP